MAQYSANSLKWVFRLYPPYIGAGVWTDYIKPDFREMKVSMRKRWYTRNAVNTHFGGSLYSMIDPHFMLMFMQILGPDYYVWDAAADIKFRKAVKEKVSAVFKISNAQLQEVLEKTQDGEKFLPVFTVEIKTDSGEVVATARKTLYIRKKKKD